MFFIIAIIVLMWSFVWWLFDHHDYGDDQSWHGASDESNRIIL